MCTRSTLPHKSPGPGPPVCLTPPTRLGYPTKLFARFSPIPRDSLALLGMETGTACPVTSLMFYWFFGSMVYLDAPASTVLSMSMVQVFRFHVGGAAASQVMVLSVHKVEDLPLM
ncbi:[Pyruvate dehydrogenase [lipoamide]] kinase isozyme 1, mitochondrial [Corchorus capsularis]|uniref:[Pyruvate dehydrogenase [lipoamide]] kinase isozyme 1, mitochondrial n=1 Tax=Corchorus capsularis TaxID=210143 RepID=A0A1R3J0G5_COCAP|nr:[Pyruvate dehydrogenase [lipoamide]] kinase isozyme 1, mitochondrial [Corchorus capsularis]